MPVVDIQSEKQSPVPPIAPRRSVHLDIAGGDFMLQGRFSDWESGLVFGPDLDRVRVRLAIDATSARRPDAEPDLLSFHSREVESVQGGGFRAVGMLSRRQGEEEDRGERRDAARPHGAGRRIVCGEEAGFR